MSSEYTPVSTEECEMRDLRVRFDSDAGTTSETEPGMSVLRQSLSGHMDP